MAPTFTYYVDPDPDREAAFELQREYCMWRVHQASSVSPFGDRRESLDRRIGILTRKPNEAVLSEQEDDIIFDNDPDWWIEERCNKYATSVNRVYLETNSDPPD